MVLEVHRSGYYKWLKGRVSERVQRRNELLKEIERVFDRSGLTYGCPRIYWDLRHRGFKCNYKTVEKLMRQHGIQPKRKRKYKSTTDSRHSLPVTENQLDRQFDGRLADEVWTSDITYIETQEGWLYLSAFIDLHSRAVVGWATSANMTTELVLDAFDMAVARRGRAPTTVHSDRGSQYASELFRSELSRFGCNQSMSRKGNCWDNAVTESFWGTLKSELIYHETYRTRKDAEFSIFRFIEIFYNKRRRHSSLGYLTPEEFSLKGKKVA